MKQFKADLHIHTLLSPCGSLEMSPAAIVDIAHTRGIDIIGIADHNTTKHCKLVSKLAAEKNIFVLCGVEVTTREEVHCLAFFPNFEALSSFQNYLDEHLPNIKNNPKYFGHQVVIDENEMIVEEEERLLISAIAQSIHQVEEKVHELGGLFIPAHIDRHKYSLLSQLGFVPAGLNADAFEITPFSTPQKLGSVLKSASTNTFIRSSDAHQPKDIGSSTTTFEMEEISFAEICKALKNSDNRKTIIVNN